MSRRLALAALAVASACYARPGSTEAESSTSDADPSSDGADSSGVDPATGVDPDPSTTDEPRDPGTTGSSASETTGSEDDTTGADVIACTADDTLDPMCPTATPFCVAGGCVACDGVPAGLCAAIDPSTPVCDADACRACVEHSECASGACRIATGECFPADTRLFVDNTADCAAADGSADAPLCTIAEAYAIIETQVGLVPWAVFIAGSATPYASAIWTDERPVAFIGPSTGIGARLVGTQLPLVVGSQNYDVSAAETYVAHVSIGPAQDAQLGVYGALVQPGSRLYLHDSLLGPDLVLGLDVYQGSATLVRSAIQRAETMVHVWSDSQLLVIDGEIDALNAADTMMTIEGDATLVRTTVDGMFGYGAGIDLTGHLRLENAVVFDSVTDIVAHDGGRFDLLYSTVARISCGSGAGASTIRNSIVPQLDCAAASIDHSAVDVGVGQGEGNVAITPADWADVFVAAASDDYRLRPAPNPVTGVARWSEGDPSTDLVGTARPMVDGTADHPGAYEP